MFRLSRMRKIIVLLAVVGCSSCSSIWSSESHGEAAGGLTLGEISLDHHGSEAFSMRGTAGHFLDFLEDHSPITNEIGDWHSSIGDLHVIPAVKYIGVPTIKKVPLTIPHPVFQTVPQPYPVVVLIPRPVPYEVQKQVIKTVEKKVPTPVEKIVPIKIEKPVPFEVVKHVPLPIEKPFPIEIPVYKTVVHKVKGR